MKVSVLMTTVTTPTVISRRNTTRLFTDQGQAMKSGMLLTPTPPLLSPMAALCLVLMFNPPLIVSQTSRHVSTAGSKFGVMQQ